MYIAIEGVKGVGKTTVINHLPQMLRDLWSDNYIEVLSPTRPMTATHPLELQYKHHRDNDDLREQLYAHRSNYHASHINWQADMIIGDRSIITSLAVRWHRVDEGLSPHAYFNQIRDREHMIKLPDIVIQLDCDNQQLLHRYARRQRDYGLSEECLEQIIALKRQYLSVKSWLATPTAINITNKAINWMVIDTSNGSDVETLQQILGIIKELKKNH